MENNGSYLIEEVVDGKLRTSTEITTNNGPYGTEILTAYSKMQVRRLLRSLTRLKRKLYAS